VATKSNGEPAASYKHAFRQLHSRTRQPTIVRVTAPVIGHSVWRVGSPAHRGLGTTFTTPRHLVAADWMALFLHGFDAERGRLVETVDFKGSQRHRSTVTAARVVAS